MGTGGTPSLQSPKVVRTQIREGGRAPTNPDSCHLNSLNIDGLPTSCREAFQLSRAFYSVLTVKFYGQAERAISNGQLSTLLHLHIRPINVVVFYGPS